MSLSNHERAASESTSAVELDGSTGLYHYNLALSLKALGRSSEADAEEAKAKALGFSAVQGEPLSRM